jgi:hypothetical protein
MKYKIMLGKPEGKRLLGRPRRRWENNITRLAYTKFPNVFFKPHHEKSPQ